MPRSRIVGFRRRAVRRRTKKMKESRAAGAVGEVKFVVPQSMRQAGDVGRLQQEGAERWSRSLALKEQRVTGGGEDTKR